MKKGENNTTSEFSLPSEFKRKWEVMVAETIVDGFGDFIVEPEQFSLMVQASFSTAIDLAELTIEKKLKAVADVLGLVDSE